MKAGKRSIRSSAATVLGALVLAVLMSVTGPASAEPAFTISNTTGQTLGNPPFTLGWQFTATNTITVTALGMFDSGQNGLAESHEVGLWNSTGTLLASGTIGSGTSMPLVNQFRYLSIPGLTIGAGVYQVGVLYTSGADAVIFPGFASDFDTATGITFIAATFAFGATLDNPVIVSGTGEANAAYFGPNFNIAAVPEPATLLLFGLGLAGLAWRRR